MKKLVVLVAVLCAASAVAAPHTITILFTSDMHAHVLPFDEVRQAPLAGSIAQAATVIEEIRGTHRDALVLDGGDAIQGTTLAHFAMTAPGDVADPTIAAMNAVGYDAAAIGNHEFNYGLPALRRALRQSDFPWLGANIDGIGKAALPIQDEVVLERGGVRIGIIGLTNANIPHWDPPSHWTGLTFSDPVEVARARVARLRGTVDLVVVVAHTGFERDLDTGAPDSGDDGNVAWRLAHVPGIDVLLTGHTHRDIPPRTVGDVIVAQPGRWAELVTRIDLDMERTEDGRWAVAGWQGENIPTRDAAADPAVVEAVAAAHEREVEALSTVIGTLGAPLEVGGVRAADDAGLDLIHAVQLEATGADLSLAAPLGMRATEFPAGPVTPRLVHALYVYPNTLVVVRVTGAQVKDILEHAVRGWTGLSCGDGGTPVLLRTPKLPPYNYDTLEGATYRVDPTAPEGHRISDLRVDGRPIDLHRSFTLAINSYRAAGGGGFPWLADAPRVEEIDRTMADLMVDFFRRHGTVTPHADGNFVFTVPLGVAVAR